MKKLKIENKYLVPNGTKLWYIKLQQSLITTKDYVIMVTHTLTNSDTSFFGDLYDIMGMGGLLKLSYGEVTCDLSLVKPFKVKKKTIDKTLIVVGDKFIAKFDTGHTYIKVCKKKEDWNGFINSKSGTQTYTKIQ